ncbi:hypothetical protein [Natronorubrum sp. DTA7]|uniref:hypothetical protein n=1 Tax=Natronorubrum sp. DTA7 TaxID=3447016 RepID=UPI003F850B80
MKGYMITYRLNAPGQDYEELHEAIKAYPAYAKCLNATWIVKTDKSAADIRDDLLDETDYNDEILVTKLSGAAAWSGLSDEISDWIQENL